MHYVLQDIGVTLAQYIRALGGSLEIRAVFPDSEVRITQFEASK